MQLAPGRVQGLAQEAASGTLPQLPQHRAAVPETRGPQSRGPGLHLGLCSIGDSHRPGSQRAQGSEGGLALPSL